MTYLHETNLILSLAQRFHDPVDPITGKAEHDVNSQAISVSTRISAALGMAQLHNDLRARTTRPSKSSGSGRVAGRRARGAHFLKAGELRFSAEVRDAWSNST